MENTSLTHFDVYLSYHLKMNYLELKNTRKLIEGGGGEEMFNTQDLNHRWCRSYTAYPSN